MNTLREHDFQDELKKRAEGLGIVHTRGKENASRMMEAGRPKLIFHQMAAPATKIMDTIRTLTS
jgi:hypothetical protein